MPQVIIELSTAVDCVEAQVLHSVNRALGESGVFHLHDIKSRLYKPEYQNWNLVGDGRGDQAFAYVKVAIMPGRSDEIKADLAERVMTALKSTLAAKNPTMQYGVEVVDLMGYLKG